ncbi:MAG: hypothetical protein NDJ65_07330 [Paludibacteraceae bacterium]|nr:hypothetical protein [Paludibacteraceae bacterium]
MLVHPEKERYPIAVILSGISTFFKETHDIKVLSPIADNVLGIFISSNFIQYPKAPFPMLVTPSGIVTLVKPLQWKNAELPMLVTPFGMVMLVSPSQLENAKLPILSISLLKNTKLERFIQSLNKPAGKHFTSSPISTLEIFDFAETHVSRI